MKNKGGGGGGGKGKGGRRRRVNSRIRSFIIAAVVQ